MSSDSPTAAPLWTPSAERIRSTQLDAFRREINARFGLSLETYDDLHTWSVSEVSSFWEAVWQFTGLVRSTEPTRVMGEPRMPGTVWFEDARLNFAENLLRHRDSDRVALYAIREGQDAPTALTYRELADRVARLRTWMKAHGVGPGDRVAAFISNVPEAVIGMLAAASLGAVWSSCSPDFGFNGVMDRFGQIAPKLLIAIDGYRYNGKAFDTRERVAQVAATIDSIEHVLVVSQLGENDLSGIRGAVPWATALATEAEPLAFAQLPFDHPLYILYSSGTTGVPKCIVHGAGGTLLQHAKELVLHTDVSEDDVVFYFTTCGWMMWNWLVSTLLTGASVVLFDGSPAHPDVSVLWRMAASLRISVFGTSPKFLTLCEKSGLKPATDHDLSALRAVLSTGAPLSVENFEYVYEAIGDVQLASIAGGTDIVSCFMLGSPVSPVYPGEIQKRGLGMDVHAYDDDAKSVVSEKGELVCITPFPSMPVGFYGDEDGSRYRGAYFEHFPGVWRHGDYVEITEHGGVIIYGRSDATLNPGGVRIGTAEIYRQVEALDEVVDALVVGQPFKDDVRVLLFVVLRDGLTLDDDGVAKIKKQIRANTTPRHVPARVLQVPAIPRTISGKRVELAVRRILTGEKVTNRDALANPESLAAFEALRDELSA
ncbi:MAG: acetoacetate--CoA ligase [Deltaproteobacteria bacterium]|nr:MAG: acetoacetate--CoA ligase [Deltaproteobacteria bacterium]